MGKMVNSPAPTTVGSAVAKGAAYNTSSTPSNQMGMGTQRDRGGDTFLTVNVDPINSNKITKLHAAAPGTTIDRSLIANTTP